MTEPTVAEMRLRVRRHMLTSAGGLVFALLSMVVGGGAIRAFGGTAPWTGTAMAIVMVASIASVPAIGLTSTFRNLRCPACNGLVARQVSMKFSAFGAMASNQCRHCGATIFAPRAARRFFLAIAIVAALFFLGAIVAGSFVSVSRRHAAHPATTSGK